MKFIKVQKNTDGQYISYYPLKNLVKIQPSQVNSTGALSTRITLTFRAPGWQNFLEYQKIQLKFTGDDFTQDERADMIKTISEHIATTAKRKNIIDLGSETKGFRPLSSKIEVVYVDGTN